MNRRALLATERRSKNSASDELLSCRFVNSSEFDDYLLPRLSRRLRAALSALESRFGVELEHGTASLKSKTTHSTIDGENSSSG